MELGPSHDQLKPYDKNLLDFIDDCNKYVSNLPIFDKYCVWRYTIGSASVNYRLIFGSLSPNTPRWVYLFFKYFKNTVNNLMQKNVTPELLPGFFKNYIGYFNDPISYNKLPEKTKMNIGAIILSMYDKKLSSILRNGPKVSGDGFTVYKVSSYYPALPDIKQFKPTAVKQLPFNSVTVMNQFNFEPFMAKDKENYIFSIKIPGGTTGILYVPTDLHAYAFEHEIILPHDINFMITNFSTQLVNYVNREEVNTSMVQKDSDIMLGNVFVLNEYSPCKLGSCYIRSKYMTVFNAIYQD